MLSRYFAFFVLLTALPVWVKSESRSFTNKKGVKVEAEMVSVTADWKKVTIRTARGPFEMPIIELSLDDQQYIKEWLKEREATEPGTGASIGAEPASGSDFELAVNIDRRSSTIDRIDYSSTYRLVAREYSFEIEVTNRSRQAIPALLVDYAVLWKEKIKITDESYSRNYKKNSTFAKKDQVKLEFLSQNRPETFETKSAIIEALELRAGGEADAEDELLGLIVQISAEDGTIIKTYKEGEIESDETITWASVSTLPGSPEDFVGSIVSAADDDDEVYTVRLKKGQVTEGPIDFAERPVKIDVDEIIPDTQNPDGVIVEVGGETAGVSIYIKERRIYTAVKRPNVTQFIWKTLPLGSFGATVELNEKGLTMVLDGSAPVTRDDIALLDSETSDGASVGSVTSVPAGDYEEDFSFQGDIRGVTITIGE